MEVAHPAPETFTGSFRKKTPLPLGQLVEETRKGADVPHHLLETRIYAKLKSNTVIQAEPSELHFSGFELGKNYQKVLKLINISSEVINIHILSTQTKYFQTKYSKKHRLVPGLSYTVKVHFCPDEWRYFYDCVRVHCKGEENLLVPVHAYPIIDDLHIPSHINLPAVPVGQSFSHAIPLSCSCPIDFEFQVYCLQPHKAFSVHPLSGVIPANGFAEVTVTFTPLQYGTAQVTLQVVISQFNSKPYVCTISGSSSPYLAISQQEEYTEHGEISPKDGRGLVPVSAATKPKITTTRTLEKSKALKEQKKPDAQCQKTPIDVSTPAGVAKMLIQQQDKMSSKDLREAMSQTKIAHQTRQMREAVFENQVRRDIQEERANHLRWQVHLGKDPVSTQTKMQILEEREIADYEYKIKKGEVLTEEDFARALPKLSTRRVLRNAGQLPDSVPVFHIYSSNQLEVRQRALRVFQQAARKVILRCRMNNRLLSLRELIHSMKKLSNVGKASEVEAKPLLLALSPGSLQPFTFPIFTPPYEVDELAPNALGPVPVKSVQALIKPHTPFFNLKVPQHYRLMGYQPVSAFEAAASYIPPTLSRTLRTGAQDELLPRVIRPSSECSMVEPEGQEQEAERGDESPPALTFNSPAALMKPPQAHPLRIFNPAPGLHAFKPTPSYLECDLDFHLCPLPRYTVSKSDVIGVYTPTTQKKYLVRTDVIRGVMTWKKSSAALSIMSSNPTLTSNWAPRMSDPFNSTMLPSVAPPGLDDLPEEIREEIQDGQPETTAVTLTPEMIRAEFHLLESSPLMEETARDGRSLSPCKTPQMMLLAPGTTSRETREQQLESSFKSQANKLGLKVLARVNHLKGMAKPSTPSSPDCK